MLFLWRIDKDDFALCKIKSNKQHKDGVKTPPPSEHSILFAKGLSFAI